MKSDQPFNQWLATQQEKTKREFPQAGDKLTFKSADGLFYPHYTNVIANAKAKLVVDQEYTVRQCKVYSSWCAVWLEGLPGEDQFFHLSMFKRG